MNLIFTILIPLGMISSLLKFIGVKTDTFSLFERSMDVVDLGVYCWQVPAAVLLLLVAEQIIIQTFDLIGSAYAYLSTWCWSRLTYYGLRLKHQRYWQATCST